MKTALKYRNGHARPTLSVSQLMQELAKMPPDAPAAGFWDGREWPVLECRLVETDPVAVAPYVVIDVSKD